MDAPPSPDSVFAPGEPRYWLEEEVLPRYVTGSRWFGGKARAPESFCVSELFSLPSAPDNARLALLRVGYRDGASELYQLPLAILPESAGRSLAVDSPGAVIAELDNAVLCDGLYDPDFRDAFVRLVQKSGIVAGEGGDLVGAASAGLPGLLSDAAWPSTSRVLRVEQSNSSMIFGDSLFVKIVRKLEEGVNPDAEILRFLTEHQTFRHSPAFGGMLEFHAEGRPPRLLALATSVVANEGDAWTFTLGELARFLDQAQSSDSASPSGDSLLREMVGDAFLERVAQLGRRTGEMHKALVGNATDQEFAPEPLTTGDLRELQETTVSSLETVLALLEKTSPASGTPVARLLQRAPSTRALASSLSAEEIHAAKTRHHGDYHLGQVLDTGSDFVIIDFEGEPARSLAERRRKRSPLRDVAGMLRSFHYAAHCAIRAHSGSPDALTPLGEQWSRLIGKVFLDAWTESTAGAPFVPETPAHRQRLLDAFLLEKAVYEIGYELNNRPAWIDIPVRGLLSLLNQ